MKSVSAYVDLGNRATFPCPHCDKTYSVMVDKYRNTKHRLTTRCICDQKFVINLDFRQNYRKQVTLAAQITDLSTDFERWSAVTITDLSMGGLQFRLVDDRSLKVGSKLRIKFTLDDRQAHQLERSIKVASIREGCYGCEFLNPHYDKNLGYYLRP